VLFWLETNVRFWLRVAKRSFGTYRAKKGFVGGAEVQTFLSLAFILCKAGLVEEQTHNPKIKLNRSTQPDRIRIPRNIMVTRRNSVHVIGTNNTRKANNKSNAKEQGNYDALPQRKIQAKNNGDWDEHNAKVIEYIETPMDREVDILIDAMLWNKG
jgi:hypothetical protein